MKTATRNGCPTWAADSPVLAQMNWCMNGEVVRSDDLALAQQAESEIFASGRSLLDGEPLGHGVYRFTYARVTVGVFVFGAQQQEEDFLTLYYFASSPETEPCFALVEGDDIVIAYAASFEEAKAKRDELGCNGYSIVPTLSYRLLLV